LDGDVERLFRAGDEATIFTSRSSAAPNSGGPANASI
jgi:hypothetical protein